MVITIRITSTTIIITTTITTTEPTRIMVTTMETVLTTVCSRFVYMLIFEVLLCTDILRNKKKSYIRQLVRNAAFAPSERALIPVMLNLADLTDQFVFCTGKETEKSVKSTNTSKN